ncbi:hypothetical protein AAFF_G00031520 [Aldrovandia affinis]|uniref:Uncharacterized protein n=1 Tax=Aldrovandia affinis TaxID=143900 RepID=A0AAD7S420_9TELE|nr:hypothetical protein AAFF_G00031520 [Aldrovandia affinis]
MVSSRSMHWFKRELMDPLRRRVVSHSCCRAPGRLSATVHARHTDDTRGVTFAHGLAGSRVESPRPPPSLSFLTATLFPGGNQRDPKTSTGQWVRSTLATRLTPESGALWRLGRALSKQEVAF